MRPRIGPRGWAGQKVGSLVLVFVQPTSHQQSRLARRVVGGCYRDVAGAAFVLWATVVRASSHLRRVVGDIVCGPLARRRLPPRFGSRLQFLRHIGRMHVRLVCV